MKKKLIRLIVMMGIVSGFVAPLYADISDTDFIDYQKRIANLSEQLSRNKDNPPRLGTPAGDALFLPVFDLKKLADEPMTVADMPKISALMKSNTLILMSYITHEGMTQADVEKSLKKYENEFIQFMVLTLYLGVAANESENAMFAHTSADDLNDMVRKGIIQMHRGMLQTVSGVAVTLSDPDLSTQSRAILVDALEATLPRLLRNLSVEERRSLVSNMRIGYKYLDDRQNAAIQKIMDNIENMPCDNACRVTKASY